MQSSSHAQTRWEELKNLVSACSSAQEDKERQELCRRLLTALRFLDIPRIQDSLDDQTVALLYILQLVTRDIHWNLATDSTYGVPREYRGIQDHLAKALDETVGGSDKMDRVLEEVAPALVAFHQCIQRLDRFYRDDYQQPI